MKLVEKIKRTIETNKLNPKIRRTKFVLLFYSYNGIGLGNKFI